MDKIKPRILVVDDEDDMLLLYKNILKKDHVIIPVSSGREAIKMISRESVDLVILDIIMPDVNGIEVLKKIKDMDSTIDFIMVTASKEIKPAVDSLKLGAFDYIVKPFEAEDLLSSVKKALERRQIIRENIYLKQALSERASFGQLIGNSEKMRDVYGIIEKASDSDSTILITGESGTGKEIVAEVIHKKSKRNSMPYIIVNCAAIPENLLESEMFGHERGAFTGAMERHIGKFELANGGTIFLDEIGEMPMAMQAKLLRVLQDGMIERVGGEKTIPVNVRTIAATNLDLRKAIQDKKFREDLYYRLNVIPISLPPLRERAQDIHLFVNYFIDRYNKELNKSIKNVTKDAMDALIKYAWPGNIRELENLIERLVTLSRDDHIDTCHIPQEIINPNPAGKEVPAIQEGSFLRAVRDFEKDMVIRALESSNWNQTNAAKLLGIHRTTLISKMEAFGIKD